MSYYGNMNISGERGMEIEYEGMVNNSSDDQTESEYSDSKRHRTPPNTVKIRNYRSAVVCLVLLCVLLLIALIVLCVHIHTIRTNCTQERDEVITEKENLSKERDQLPVVVKGIYYSGY
ncbi:CD209 antigen-like protein [Labeo rohita]|uniref:CD209 antigen-like protein n=1 Tax=Labeo rohita TaxID=84645 RepID=A0A498NL96_LABRO|nr:CD209 antigen-like protein [Labeo rohita]